MGAFKLYWHPNILGFGTQPNQSKSQGVRAEFVDHIQRIDSVPFAFGHGLAIAIKDFRMDENFAERNFADVVESHEYHACDPQRDDISGSNESACRIKVLQVSRLFGPAQGRMRP